MLCTSKRLTELSGVRALTPSTRHSLLNWLTTFAPFSKRTTWTACAVLDVTVTIFLLLLDAGGQIRFLQVPGDWGLKDRRLRREISSTISSLKSASETFHTVRRLYHRSKFVPITFRGILLTAYERGKDGNLDHISGDERDEYASGCSGPHRHSNFWKRPWSLGLKQFQNPTGWPLPVRVATKEELPTNYRRKGSNGKTRRVQIMKQSAHSFSSV